MQASRKLEFMNFMNSWTQYEEMKNETRQTKSSSWKELTSLMLVFMCFLFPYLWWKWSLIQTKSQFQFPQTTWTFLANCYFGFSNWFMSFVVNVHKVIVCTHTKFQWRIPMQNSHRTTQKYRGLIVDQKQLWNFQTTHEFQLKTKWTAACCMCRMQTKSGLFDPCKHCQNTANMHTKKKFASDKEYNHGPLKEAPYMFVIILWC